MRAFQVDERVDRWIGSNPAFRVILFEGGRQGASWAVDTWEVTDCGVLDAIQWATDHVAPDGAWALGLLDDLEVPGSEQPDRGYTFIEGADLNSQPQDRTPAESAQIAAMLARSDRQVLAPAHHG